MGTAKKINKNNPIKIAVDFKKRFLNIGKNNHGPNV